MWRGMEPRDRHTDPRWGGSLPPPFHLSFLPPFLALQSNGKVVAFLLNTDRNSSKVTSMV